jgi:hypothetical protein
MEFMKFKAAVKKIIEIRKKIPSESIANAVHYYFDFETGCFSPFSGRDTTSLTKEDKINLINQALNAQNKQTEIKKFLETRQAKDLCQEKLTSVNKSSIQQDYVFIKKTCLAVHKILNNDLDETGTLLFLFKQYFVPNIHYNQALKLLDHPETLILVETIQGQVKAIVNQWILSINEMPERCITGFDQFLESLTQEGVVQHCLSARLFLHGDVQRLLEHYTQDQLIEVLKKLAKLAHDLPPVSSYLRSSKNIFEFLKAFESYQDRSVSEFVSEWVEPSFKNIKDRYDSTVLYEKKLTKSIFNKINEKLGTNRKEHGCVVAHQIEDENFKNHLTSPRHGDDRSLGIAALYTQKIIFDKKSDKKPDFLFWNINEGKGKKIRNLKKIISNYVDEKIPDDYGCNKMTPKQSCLYIHVPVISGDSTGCGELKLSIYLENKENDLLIFRKAFRVDESRALEPQRYSKLEKQGKKEEEEDELLLLLSKKEEITPIYLLHSIISASEVTQSDRPIENLHNTQSNLFKKAKEDLDQKIRPIVSVFCTYKYSKNDSSSESDVSDDSIGSYGEVCSLAHDGPPEQPSYAAIDAGADKTDMTNLRSCTLSGEGDYVCTGRDVHVTSPLVLNEKLIQELIRSNLTEEQIVNSVIAAMEKASNRVEQVINQLNNANQASQPSESVSFKFS